MSAAIKTSGKLDNLWITAAKRKSAMEKVACFFFFFFKSGIFQTHPPSQQYSLADCSALCSPFIQSKLVTISAVILGMKWARRIRPGKASVSKGNGFRGVQSAHLFCTADSGPGSTIKQPNIAGDKRGWEWKLKAKRRAQATVTS